MLSQKYIINEKEDSLDLEDLEAVNVVIGGNGKIKVNIEAGKVWIYATNGALVRMSGISEGNREIAVASGIYFVRVESEGINHTEKVFVQP